MSNCCEHAEPAELRGQFTAAILVSVGYKRHKGIEELRSTGGRTGIEYLPGTSVASDIAHLHHMYCALRSFAFLMDGALDMIWVWTPAHPEQHRPSAFWTSRILDQEILRPELKFYPARYHLFTVLHCHASTCSVADS